MKTLEEMKYYHELATVAMAELPHNEEQMALLQCHLRAALAGIIYRVRNDIQANVYNSLINT